jgi:CheY-like chemotaxis protein
MSEKYRPECKAMCFAAAKHHRDMCVSLKSKVAYAQQNSPPALSILFVEDEPVLRTMVARMLAYLGYAVTTAVDAQQALDLFKHNNECFDMLITDVIMPKMDGKKLYCLLKKQKRDLRVIYVSGYAEEVLRQHGIRPAHMPLLKKPFSLEKISYKIKQALMEA